MRSASPCCLAPIEVGQKKWYPLGGLIPMIDKVDYCSNCEKEVEDPVLVHSCCGLEVCECEVTV